MVMSHIFSRKKLAGFATRYLDDFVAPQRFVWKEMQEMGEQKWKSLARDTFDWERMGRNSQEEIDEYLDVFWQKREAEANSLRVQIDEDFEIISLNKISERMGKTRNVHFKSGEANYLYHKQMNSKSLFESWSHLSMPYTDLHPLPFLRTATIPASLSR